MDKPVKDMTTEELENEIVELESTYAEELGNNADLVTLSVIWKRIRDLNRELTDRKNIN
jgi:hypothetical protein